MKIEPPLNGSYRERNSRTPMLLLNVLLCCVLLCSFTLPQTTLSAKLVVALGALQFLKAWNSWQQIVSFSITFFHGGCTSSSSIHFVCANENGAQQSITPWTFHSFALIDQWVGYRALSGVTALVLHHHFPYLRQQDTCLHQEWRSDTWSLCGQIAVLRLVACVWTTVAYNPLTGQLH